MRGERKVGKYIKSIVSSEYRHCVRQTDRHKNKSQYQTCKSRTPTHLTQTPLKIMEADT